MRTPRVFAVAAGCASMLALGAPVSNTELAEVCAQAEDSAHCGRLVEAVQLRRRPSLPRREGNLLSASLYHSCSTNFSYTSPLLTTPPSHPLNHSDRTN